MFVTTLSHMCNLIVTKVKDFCIVKPSINQLNENEVFTCYDRHYDAYDSPLSRTGE